MSSWVNADLDGREVLVNLDHVKMIKWSYDGMRAIFKVDDQTLTMTVSCAVLEQALKADGIFADEDE